MRRLRPVTLVVGTADCIPATPLTLAKTRPSLMPGACDSQDRDMLELLIVSGRAVTLALAGIEN